MVNSNTRLMGAMQAERDLDSFEEAFRLIDCLCGTRLVGHLEELRQTAHVLHYLSTTPEVHIEVLFTKIDNISKGCEPLPPEYDKETFEKAARDVSYFFYHTLCLETGALISPVYYAAFADLALMPGTRRHCIITFNYDMLLEKAMCNLYVSNGISSNPIFNRNYYNPKRLPWIYDIPFSNIFCGEPYKTGDDNDVIHYLKLHGSFNWGLCPETKEITMYGPVAYAYQYQEFHDGKKTCCGGRHIQIPLLIPPTREKDINVPGIKTVRVLKKSNPPKADSQFSPLPRGEGGRGRVISQFA